MVMQINIRNININSISTLGSINIGKTFIADNRASSKQFPKSNYEENELNVEALMEGVPAEQTQAQSEE